MTAPTELTGRTVAEEERLRPGAASPVAFAPGSALPVPGLVFAGEQPPTAPIITVTGARPGLIQRLLATHPTAALGTDPGRDVIRRAPKRKTVGGSDSGGESEEEEQEDHGRRSVRSSTRTQTEDRNKKKPRTNTRPGRGDRAETAEEEEAEPDFRVSSPALYEGMRGTLWFYKSVTTAVDLLPKTCVECAGTVKLAIDHINPISEEMSEVETDLYCYGGRHYEAATFVDALSMYNARLPSKGTISAVEVGEHFQWMCGGCNSSKGGNKGIDSAAPQFKGRCLEGDDCEENQVQATGARRKKHADYE
ncbi:hypothetical protein D1871_00785 [Nakamurella silvestris]|nr:hypothetical protein D1871_00785 [Nakamurella silvestris]